MMIKENRRWILKKHFHMVQIKKYDYDIKKQKLTNRFMKNMV